MLNCSPVRVRWAAPLLVHPVTAARSTMSDSDKQQANGHHADLVEVGTPVLPQHLKQISDMLDNHRSRLDEFRRKVDTLLSCESLARLAFAVVEE